MAVLCRVLIVLCFVFTTSKASVDVRVIDGFHGDIPYDGAVLRDDYHYDRIHEDFSFQDDFLAGAAQSHRKRRSIGGMGVQGLSASQTCDGITLEWLPSGLPYSPNYPYNHSEFKHYNVYRSNVFFKDVTGMTPHASGLTDPKLRHTETSEWVDRWPTGMVDWFYAVTIVDGKGKEDKSVTVVKAKFIGAFEKNGKPFLMIPSMLRGRAMHHSVVFNDKRNEYFVAFDWDANYDGIADHIYALRLNQAARIVDKTVLNITATLPGWIGGDQGWPSAAYNPSSNEYLVIFHLRSLRHFGSNYIIIGQRLFATKTERSASPAIVARFDGNIDAKKPKLLYNPKTGGYVASLIADKPSKDIVALFLDNVGQTVTSKQVCSFKTSAYEHNLFHDTKRAEFYFTCALEKRGANADFKLKQYPFLLLMTKMDANGGHAASSPPGTKTLVGYSSKRYTRHDGYYNEKTDRLVLFWEDMNKGKNTIASSSYIMTRQIFIWNPTKYRCSTTGLEVKTPVPLPLETTGGHYLLWQERSQFSWNIGGYLMKGNFKLTKGVQKNPVVVSNSVTRQGFVVWQEDFGREIRLIGRHFIESSSHSCRSPACQANQKCVQENKCVSTVSDRCSVNNGNCSHTCTDINGGRDRLCSCPSNMDLQQDKKTCKDRHNNNLPEFTALIASEGVIWRATENQKQRKASIERMPFTQGERIVAVGYDSQDKRVYWSDVNRGVIKRAHMDGSGEETIVSFAKVPDGLCIDVEGRQIYWTDTGFNKIEKALLDGSAKQTIVDTGLDEPRAIILHKTRGQIYWTDWGKTAKIERAALDGTQRKTIIKGGLVWPNGLVIDEENSVLYWADAKLDKIETSDLEGGNRRLLADDTVVKHPFSLAILNKRLFWTDWETASLQSIDKRTGKDYRISFTGLRNPKGMFVFFTKGKKCMDPGIPDKGGRHPSPDPSGHYSTGSTVVFTCRPGYTMIGPSRSTCLKSGKWDKKDTLCKVPPVFTAFPVNQTMNDGDSLVMKCSASVQGKPIQVKWNKNGSPLNPSKSVDYFVGKKGHLIFLDVHFDDQGVYECIAENEAGKVSAKAHLRVRGTVKLKECGRPRYKTRARIIGGRRADRGAHPWQVMLWNNKQNKHFCGGTLISDRWVVTAAHCVSKISLFPSDIQLRFGKHVRTRNERSEQSIVADTIKMYPGFNRPTYDSDIALIRASKKVIFTDYIQPICLPSSESDYGLLRVNNTGVISGWGSRKELRHAARRLHEANVPVVSQEQCIASHSPRYIVTANMFCAGYKNSSLGDACQGDSGGPFSINNPQLAIPFKTRHVLMGVVSWGDGCGRYGKYGVYTRLTNFIDWIMSQIIN